MKKLLLLSLIFLSIGTNADNHVKDHHKLQEASNLYTVLVTQIKIDLNEGGLVIFGGPSDGAICQVTPEACSGFSSD